MDELLRVERDGASNSSSSQARQGEINKRAKERERISGMEEIKDDCGRFFMKGGGSRPGV
jgi:hypothetical protein